MRTDSFKSLVGSHNYNLNTPDSDKDYKVFFYPSFEDLYSGEKYSKAKTSESVDVEYHDIRKLPDMLWKSNVNFVEVLFSRHNHINDALYSVLHNRREEIASMNLPYLYDACMGMFYKKKKEYQRDLEKGEAWKKIGKHVMSAVRIVDFLQRYEYNGWNFENAIYYKEGEFLRQTLLNLRNGMYESKNELDIFIDSSEKLLVAIKPKYKSHVENTVIKEWLYDVVKNEVKLNIQDEIGLS